MGVQWDSPRGEQLFRLYLTGEFGDPDAKEFPTSEELESLSEADLELIQPADSEQIAEFVTTATDFLKARGTTVHVFSLQAIAQVKGQFPLESVRLALDGDKLDLTAFLALTESMQEYVDRVSKGESWQRMPLEIAIDVDDQSNTTNVRIDRFDVRTKAHESITHKSYWPDGSPAERDTTHIGFRVQDYLFGQNLIASEQNPA